MEFKDYLKRMRKRSGLTQDELARLLKCSQSAISAWETGSCVPSLAQVRAICRVFPNILEDLFGEPRRRPRGRERPPSGLVGLAALRKGRQLSRAQLARMLGVSEKTVSNWESQGIPHLAQMKMLVNYFHIDINELQE